MTALCIHVNLVALLTLPLLRCWLILTIQEDERDVCSVFLSDPVAKTIAEVATLLVLQAEVAERL